MKLDNIHININDPENNLNTGRRNSTTKGWEESTMKKVGSTKRVV